VGSFGVAGFTSLETVKTLPAFGGGLVTTRDAELGERVARMAARLDDPAGLKLAGKVALGHVEALLAHPGAYTLVGWPLMRALGGESLVGAYKKGKKGAGNHHARLHPAQASVALNSLVGLRAHVAERRRRAETFLTMIGDGPWRPHIDPRDGSAWYQLVMRTGQSSQCAESCLEAGVDVGRHVLTDLSSGRCREAARLASEAIQLPCHPGLDDDDLRVVADAVRGWLA
jgi:dTDP-4-amino-4,6-dideoxygalactose transaminase